MRICIVVDNLDPHAGWGRLALRVAEGFKNNGHEVSFIIEKKPKNIIDKNLIIPLRLSLKNILRLPLTLLLIRNFFMRWAYNRSKRILVVSEFTKREIEKSGFKLKDASIVPVGVDTDYFHPISDKERISSYPFVLSVGALKDRKGY